MRCSAILGTEIVGRCGADLEAATTRLDSDGAEGASEKFQPPKNGASQMQVRGRHGMA